MHVMRQRLIGYFVFFVGFYAETEKVPLSICHR